MDYPPCETERVMKVQEVFARAFSGQIRWPQVCEILDVDPRTVRRWKRYYEAHGYDGLYDRRRKRPSPRRAATAEVERVLRLYRERYARFNVRHFHELARRDHDVRLSYTFVKRALQEAGLVKKRRPRGRHRLRREPRPCFGEMLHLDGSPHRWLTLVPDARQTLMSVVDDATSQLLYAQLVAAESTDTVMGALHAVLSEHGIPGALYTDRASWAVYTKRAGEYDEPAAPTQVGRALKRLGVEHILARSPQARGRGERVHRTLQDRLVNELRLAGITTIEVANRYIRERFLSEYNARFSRPAADAQSAFVSLGGVDLEQVLCHEEERRVANDNTVVFEKVRLQIAKQPGRSSCAGMPVVVRRHLDGTLTVWRANQRLGVYEATGQPRPCARAAPGTRPRHAPGSSRPRPPLRAVPPPRTTPDIPATPSR